MEVRESEKIGGDVTAGRMEVSVCVGFAQM